MTQSLAQGSQAWFDARKGMLTGSRVGAILGLNPYSKPDDVLREMIREAHGAEREFVGNIATDWGNKHENTALAEYENATASMVISTGFYAHTDYVWLGASPDGIIGEGLIEVKCPFSQKIKTLAEQPHYAAQVQLQLEVTDKSWCDFVTWTPDQLVIERVKRDANWLTDNFDTLSRFHDRYLSELDNQIHLEPLVLYREDNEWCQAEADYISAKNAVDDAQVALAYEKGRLLEMTDKKTRGPHLMAYPVVKSGSVSYSKVVKELLPDADLERFKGNPSTSWTIKVL